ncbi:MAG: cell envelope integrity protein TolA [Alcanivorax sp.]|nr:cell envelope integrity protein TolA [Alcanivorax sp.]
MSDRAVGLIVTLFIHLLVIGLLTLTWLSEPSLQQAPVVPPHVKATMVEKSRQRSEPVAKPKPQPKVKPKPKAKPKPKPKPKPEPKPKPKPKPEPKAKPKPKPTSKPKPAPEPKPALPDIKEPSIEEMMAEEELEMEAKQEQAEQQKADKPQSNADKADAEVASYTDAIRSAVAQRWRIPGNYRGRDDIKAQVRIQMIPGGEVVDVSVVKSSGYPDFDESVMAAVKLASPLPVPDGALFDKTFRSFLIEFDPGVAK